MGDVRDGLEVSIAAAVADKRLGELDEGALAAARALADKIDAWDVIVQWALDDFEADLTARPMVPANDNVSLSAFLRYCEALGLTPAGRAKLEPAKEAPGGGKLASYQDAAARRRARSA